MKKITFVILASIVMAILGVLIGETIVAADNRRFVDKSTLLAVPQYSAGFQGPPIGAYSDPLSKEILAEVRALRRDLEDFRVAMGQPPRLEIRAEAAVGIVKAKCAACHGEAVAAKAGKGLVLLDRGGRIPELDGAKVGKVILRAHNQTMPPKERQKEFPPLSDEEYAQLVQFFGSRDNPKPEPGKKPVP